MKNFSHFHLVDKRIWKECYCQCRSILLNWQFWLGLSCGFPLEHLLWEKVWPFDALTKFLGL